MHSLNKQIYTEYTQISHTVSRVHSDHSHTVSRVHSDHTVTTVIHYSEVVFLLGLRPVAPPTVPVVDYAWQGRPLP